ncbi:alpha-glucan family phosphorylase [Halothermothrix orenii]|uniref:Alpha-glucan phosphorylase n=1 Tax=Halothermothrix orenii (strain H 168 / OCM 544 / DSM 9562) TaxID=373903 RepID=B8CWF0_HALOH|nr:alpha-glucan family phosphorylase [Halothermothrix orenii]ACL69619.1 alpha-glucan phosphorylase [Halothermothrix orenii H 168]
MAENKEKIAYFCMEYGLDQKLPLYAGGLGVLAGDYLKAAHDKKAPIIGIGMLWWQDYTTQLIGKDGYPHDTYPTYSFDYIEDTGITVTVQIEGKDVNCKIYKTNQFENAPLYLLDAGHPDSEFGWINDRLYGGDDRKRIAQEIVLGIGGVRALRALNIEVDKYHFNEGHAAFAGFELIREKMNNNNMDFENALEETRKEIVFTTHTPVSAGNEQHHLDLIESMGANNGLTREQLWQIGGDPFNMTAACLHMSYVANGVSKLHGETARRMWQHLDKKAPIISITNGVHVKTWQNPEIKEAFEQNKNLWDVHMKYKKKLVNFIAEKTDARMNPDNLIVGFARRAAPYKRSELIFRDTDKIDDLLTSGKMQLVFSGKAHPNDHYGKDIVATLVKMDQKYKDNVVFLENYGMKITKYLVQGCDVWLNNPRRPLEASGTSGMKAAINGVLNLSVLDGWVAEGPEHGISGWIIDEVFESLDEKLEEDEKDLKALYKILREEVIPIYYNDRDRWEEMMKASIAMSHRKFSAARMLEDYYNLMYNKKAEPALI